MYTSQQPWVDLFHTILGFQGRNIFTEILSAWSQQNFREVEWLQEFVQRRNANWPYASDEDLCRLYAIFRVTSILLLRFQSVRTDGSDYLGPLITIDEFVHFHESLGFHVEEQDDFHPFYHEIISVDPLPEAEAQLAIVDYRWPCLMLGDMMFCRAGTVVEAGSLYVKKEVAESSKLYWTYRRKDRRYEDLSHGWGHNSQWATNMRRDYRTLDAFHFNVDGEYCLNDVFDINEPLAREELIELVRHRCMIRTELKAREPFPYSYRYSEKRS